MVDNIAPKAFISYSWSSATHQDWVISLAERLVGDGVDVLFDKWDLQPGRDSIKFMEQMATDASVSKVLMICDRAYADKANNRLGGVGVESQILTPGLYDNKHPEKYAALITEYREDGKAPVPAFYGGRIFMDFSETAQSESSYDMLLRWLYDKPLYIKPPVGSRPKYLDGPAQVQLPTIAKSRRLIDAIRSSSNHTPGLVDELFAELRLDLLTLSEAEGSTGHYDDRLIAFLKTTHPLIRALEDVFTGIASYVTDSEAFESLGLGLEHVGMLMFRPEELTQWSPHQFAHYKVFLHVVFLRLCSILIDKQRFTLLDSLLSKQYLIENSDTGGDSSTDSFLVFNQDVESLRHRNSRLQLKRVSLYADVVKEFFAENAVFVSVMQADLLLFLRSVTIESSMWSRWYPFSVVYAMQRYKPFAIFARSESRSFFAKISVVINCKTIAEFKDMISNLDAERGLTFEYHSVSLSRLTNSKNIGGAA